MLKDALEISFAQSISTTGGHSVIQLDIQFWLIGTWNWDLEHANNDPV